MSYVNFKDHSGYNLKRINFIGIIFTIMFTKKICTVILLLINIFITTGFNTTVWAQHRETYAVVILYIVIATYGSYASLLSDRSDKLYLSPYYDTLGDYYVEDPLLETYSEDADPEESNFSENTWEHDTGIIGRQLPESGEFKLNQDKKSQIWCKVKKVIRHHHEQGFEFFPKSYSEYDCIPNTNFDGSSENSIFSSDVCPVHHGRCISLQKQYYFLKKRVSERCWKLEKKPLKVGCKCLPASHKN